jgi:diguanylate cyclase (GGDEF)-like protein
MAEPGRSQLQMLLVQQAGSGALPLSILSANGPNGFLPFLRTVEQLCVDERLAPVVVYWARQATAPMLLPTGQRYKELMRDAFRVSIFADDQVEPPEQWSFLVESRGLCLIVYGQQVSESGAADKFQCSGSMDPAVVRQAVNSLLPIWQAVNPADADALEDARFNMGPTESAIPYIQRIRTAWPVIKSPIQQSLMLQPSAPRDDFDQQALTNLFSEPGKIQPIATDPDGSIFKMPGSPVPVRPTGPVNPLLMTPTDAMQLKMRTGDFALPSTQSNATMQMPDATMTEAARIAGLQSDGGGNFIKPPTAIGADGEGDGAAEPYVFPAAAQSIISEIIGQLRQSNDLALILQFAIEKLTDVVKAERGLIWKIVGDQLAVTNEYTASGHTCFAGNQLGPQESTAIVYEFLSRFPDESGAGVISVPDTARDTNLHKVSQTLSSLIELGDVRARLMVQLRSRGVFSGFLELQQCGRTRAWTTQEAEILQKVAEMLSVVVQQSVDQSKIEMDAREMKLINEIASLFRESRGQTSQESLVKSVMLVADHMGFTHSQIYLYSAEEKLLIPQIQDGSGAPVDLSTKDDPFVAVFESGRGKIVNAEFTKRGDPFFKHETALVLPLVSEGERLGVIGLWERLKNKPQFRPQDRELGLTIAGHLSNVIRADQAIGQLRSDRARAALINKVSSEIRQSLKEVDQIMRTLVSALQEHFSLELCVVSLYDSQVQDFTKSKTASESGADTSEADAMAPNIGEHLFLVHLEELKAGQTIYLPHDELVKKLEGREIQVPAQYKSATLLPLIHAGNFKAALCMVSTARANQLPDKDMKMVADLADRVAVVVSHAELFAQVEKQAVTDAMTGLYNRRYFNEQLTKEIDRFQRFGHAFSFIIVDLDFLKKINDSLGHHHGDSAIKHIANVLKRNVRDVDTVARFGGEEFVILLPETDLAPARMVAERICHAIREKPIENVGTVTASLGLATWPYDAQEREKLFELADQALFLAKHRGRNQVCSVAEDLMPSLMEGNTVLLEQMAQQSQTSTSANVPLSIEHVDGQFDLSMVVEEGIIGVFGKIIKAVEERDGYGTERSPRAYNYASRIAQTLRLSKEHAEIVSLAAVMSNLGKVAIPEEILRKEGPLTPEEMEQMKRAPEIGAKILEPSKTLYRVSNIIEFYHEHWDGSGYPKGMKGDEIPLESRIIALVDAYTAMTSDRPYRKKMTKEEAIASIQASAGVKFDPRLVKIFLTILSKENGETPAVTT